MHQVLSESQINKVWKQIAFGGKAKEGFKDSLRFLTGTKYVIKMSSKCVSNMLLLLFLVIFMFFLSEYILFNSYKNK